MADLLAELVGPEKCVSCAACIGSGRTLTGAPCPRCDGHPWISHGWGCSWPLGHGNIPPGAQR